MEDDNVGLLDDIREGCRNFRDNIEAELGIDSTERWERELDEERAQKTRKKAKKHLARKKKKRENLEELGIESDDTPQIIHGSPICIFEEPEIGAVIYCDLGLVEHSGIYVGNKEVVQLNSSGEIEKVSLHKFTDSILTLNPIIRVPFNNSDDKYTYDYTANSIGSRVVATNARKMIGKQREYCMLMDNCHQFCAGCLTGEFENAINFLIFLKDEVEECINNGNPVKWEYWNWVDEVLV